MEEKEQPHCQRKDYVAWQTAGDKLKGENYEKRRKFSGFGIVYSRGGGTWICHASMPDAIVKEAVDRAADRAAYKAVQSATVTAVNQVRHDIQKEVKTAVDNAYADLRGKVEREISDQIGNIDISSIVYPGGCAESKVLYSDGCIGTGGKESHIRYCDERD